MNEWIKTCEMLPSTRKTCLIYSRMMQEIMMAKWSLDDREWNCISHNYNFCDEKMQQSITHWQYLPTMPEPPNE